MKIYIHIITTFILIFNINAYSQDNPALSSFDVFGYLSGMPSVYWTSDTSLWQTTLHNRLNFNWYISDAFTASVQLRNQLMYSDFIESNNIETGFVKDNYFLPLSYRAAFGDKYLLSLSADRAWLQYTHKNLEIKAGRQRINWGQTFVWNPNDLFNSYNFFDIDYPERPGADAIRLQYYTGATSSLDLASKIDSAGNISAAGLYRFNRWNYDFQILVGLLQQSNIISTGYQVTEWNDKDLVSGLGFSGAIKNMSLRGEMSYFHSLKDDNDSTNMIITSLALDYSFPDQTYLMVEFLYNSNVLLSESTSFLNFYSGSQNVKTLTVTKYNFFSQVTYPLIPIVNTTFGGMLFWDDNLLGYYIGPSIDVSLGNNLTFSTFYQFFSFRIQNPITQKKTWYNSNFLFLRLKWNF